MKFFNNEKKLLLIIKYGPVFFVLLISLIITQKLLSEEEKHNKLELKYIENSYLENNKKRVKEEIEEVYNYILKEKNKSETLLKQNIKNRVYEAHKIATSIYHTNLSLNIHSYEHTFLTIKNVLGNIIYNNGRGYYFIDDINGIKLLQPFNKSFENLNLSDYVDANGYKFVHKIKETILNKTEAFDSYYWFKPNDKNKSYKKISFYKYFEPFNVAIGTGEYIDDFENDLKKELLKKINSIRYSNNGYIFIYDLKGNCLSHYKKELVGKNRLNYQDENGSFLIQDILTYAQNNGKGFISYKTDEILNDTISTSLKISYLKLFKDWGWVIGTGFYTDILKKEMEEKKELLIKNEHESIKQIIYISTVLTFIFGILSYLVSKYLERILIKYKKNLRKEVKSKIEKEKMLVQQSKMATMGEMIGNIAHQWKQPLNIISLSNGLLKINQDIEGFSSKKDINEAIDNIDLSVKHLSNTIDDFRNFFRPEKEKKEYGLKDIFSKTLKLIDTQFRNNNIIIIKNIEDSKLYGYPNELSQVLINILKNARDELIKLDKDKNRLLFIFTYEEDAKAIIKIKDNAGGIPISIIDKIFQSYFTTKNNNEGTGIGLYMSKQIIEGMNGKLYVKNIKYEFNKNEYNGAEFIIELKLK